MKLYVGVTDENWYSQLRSSGVDEVNFWNPGGSTFRALQENEMFLFKLHSPNNFIVGGGFFVKFSLLPPFLAWQAFREKNGTKTYEELLSRINKYRSRNGIDSTNAQIGCTILTEPFWFDREEWIPVPNDWSNSIVRGKGYLSDSGTGKYLFDQVQERLSKKIRNVQDQTSDQRYVESMTKHRLGQGAFRIAVTDAYQRRCAVTGEKTLPVLEAAHIKPYAEEGPHTVRNGILLKSDFHTLFDDGYVTITKDLRLEVSSRLHEDYGNGKDYYKYNGQKLLVLPQSNLQLPSEEYIQWHNEHIYLG